MARPAWEKRASWAVQNASGKAPASAIDMAEGTAKASRSCKRASSAWAAPPNSPITRSPGANALTWLPTSSTMPAHSIPGWSVGTPGGGG
jgi:hypothetical protein